MTYEERAEMLEWCRVFIDKECMYRIDENHPPIPSKAGGITHGWQLYMRRATMDAEFSARIGLLFWDRFQVEFERQPFQICSCLPSGPPIGMAIQAAATKLGITINHMMVRREPKTGLDNWLDGVALKMPIMLMDDVAASTNHIRLASARVQMKLHLPLHTHYFAIINKVGARMNKNSSHTENYINGELVTLFTMDSFCGTSAQFKVRYGCAPKWTGYVG